MPNEPSPPWVDGLTIGQILSATAERCADQDALVFPQVKLRWTYRQFAEHVDQAARALLAWGIRRGDHVGIWATNVPQWVTLQFATARIGVVLVTVNPAYRPFELKYLLGQSDIKVLFLIDSFKSSDYFAMLASVCPAAAHSRCGEINSPEYPCLQLAVALRGTCDLMGAVSWSDFLARSAQTSQAALEQAVQEVRPEQPINIQYTSGTTGFPKAATLSHRNLLLNAYYSGQCQALTSRDRICIPVPFYHCFGCVLGTLSAVVYGAAMIVPTESFEASATLAAIESERATSIYGVPTMFIAQLNDPSLAGWDLSSLRTGIMAGSPCPIETMRQVIDVMHAREITIGYGQTECSPIVTQTRTDDPLELRVETVGRPIPGIEVKIVDPATGAELPENQSGELCSRGHHVMMGYYKDPQATVATIDREGWLHSGDLAMRLPNGYLRITGRLKDLVIRGGENIYPREVEEFLFTHPAIEQVAVVGVPDLKFGEELCAWIKLKAGTTANEQELRDFCRGTLAHFKVPRYIEFVDGFPQTVTGKIQKFRIREIMCARLRLEAPKTA